MATFNKDDLEKMKLAVQEAERLTSGEIVPVIAVKSSSYDFLALYFAVTAFVTSSLILFFIHRKHPFLFELEQIFVLQLAAVLLGANLGRLPFLLRALVPKARMQAAVHERALLEFVRLGLQETKYRTGVLIYVSMLEHRVEILADKGIHEKVGEGFWKEEVQRIVNGIHSKEAGSAIAQTILRVGSKLNENFPRSSEDKNELEDSVRMR